MVPTSVSSTPGAAPEPIALPEPRRRGGKPILECIAERKTIREMRAASLDAQTLSTLLWVAFGVNREQGYMGRIGRTAPSGMNLQAVDLYVATAEGAYLYDPMTHSLLMVTTADVRAMTNRRPAAADAAAVLIYVARTDMPLPTPPGMPAPAEPQTVSIFPCYGEVESGFIGQNVYLYCASEGLTSWFYSTDKEGLARALNLPAGRKVLYGQAVGFPA